MKSYENYELNLSTKNWPRVQNKLAKGLSKQKVRGNVFLKTKISNFRNKYPCKKLWPRIPTSQEVWNSVEVHLLRALTNIVFLIFT